MGVVCAWFEECTVLLLLSSWSLSWKTGNVLPLAVMLFCTSVCSALCTGLGIVLLIAMFSLRGCLLYFSLRNNICSG